MNNINIKQYISFKENIEDILCMIEEKTDKMLYKNNIVKEDLKLINKYEKKLFNLKEKLSEKNKENELLKEMLINKRNRKIDKNQFIFKYIEYLNIFNNNLNNKLFFYLEKEMLINYKNRLINELIKSSDNKLNNNSEVKNNEFKLETKIKSFDKIDNIKSINLIDLKTNENIDYKKSQEIKLNNSKNKKRKNKKIHCRKSNKSFINIKNKRIDFFDEATEIKKINTIMNNSLKKNNSEIIEKEKKYDEINSSFKKSDNKNNKSHNNIIKRRNVFKLVKLNSNNITINTENIKSNNKTISQNHSTYDLIEVRENLKKILFKDPVLKRKILNETYNPKIKKSKSIINVNKMNLNARKKIVKNKNKVNSIHKEKNLDISHLLFKNVLIKSIKNKYINEEKIKHYKLYESLINIIFIKLTLYQSIIKKNIFQIIKKISKCNIHYYINKRVINYIIGKRISNTLINLSDKYNSIMKNNKTEIMSDNEFLNELNFSSNEKINKMNEYKISLSEFKKIEKETKEIEKNISNFSNTINK